MRSRWIGLFAAAALAAPMSLAAQAGGAMAQGQHLNRMIPLLEKHLPILGIAHVSMNGARAAGGGGGGGGGAAAGRGAGGAGGAAVAGNAGGGGAGAGGARGAGGAGGGAAAGGARGAGGAGGAAVAGGGGRGAGGAAGAAAAQTPPPPPPPIADVAKETMAYGLSDFEYNSYNVNQAARYTEYMQALIAAGGSMTTHAFAAKIPIWHTDQATSTAHIREQLNQGQAAVFMQQVESSDEVKAVINAMRFTSKGGTRPENDLGIAPAYWGLTREQYLQKADVWPINPNGELLVFAIVESKEGVAHVREIAATPGLSAVVVGAGTLGGVFTNSTTNADGTVTRTRDQAGFDAAVNEIAAACKAANITCSYPANNPAEIESLMARGFTMFTMQSRNQAAFDALQKGRELGRRPMTPGGR